MITYVDMQTAEIGSVQQSLSTCEIYVVHTQNNDRCTNIRACTYNYDTYQITEQNYWINV